MAAWSEPTGLPPGQVEGTICRKPMDVRRSRCCFVCSIAASLLGLLVDVIYVAGQARCSFDCLSLSLAWCVVSKPNTFPH